MMIPRGCTVQNSFTFPFESSEVEALYITYVQLGSVVFEKTLADCLIGGGVLTTDLSQEDTLKLLTGQKIQIQIRVRLTDGRATKSNILETKTDDVLKDGVI